MLLCSAVSFILILMAKLPLRNEHNTVSEPYHKCYDCMYHKNMTLCIVCVTRLNLLIFLLPQCLMKFESEVGLVQIKLVLL